MEPRFYKYADLIIDNIEGGYYDPARHYSEAMGDSGETLFGIDRKHGGTDIKDSEAGQRFWALVDANSSSWKYNSRGGSHENELKRLAAEMMYNRYTRYTSQFISADAQRLIKKSPRLESHFYYACWNGSGWFQRFAKDINAAVAANESDLENVAINSRLQSSNSLIKRGGQIMQDKIWPQLSGRRVWGWLLFGAAVVITFVFIKKSKKNANRQLS